MELRKVHTQGRHNCRKLQEEHEAVSRARKNNYTRRRIISRGSWYEYILLPHARANRVTKDFH